MQWEVGGEAGPSPRDRHCLFAEAPATDPKGRPASCGGCLRYCSQMQGPELSTLIPCFLELCTAEGSEDMQVLLGCVTPGGSSGFGSPCDGNPPSREAGIQLPAGLPPHSPKAAESLRNPRSPIRKVSWGTRPPTSDFPTDPAAQGPLCQSHFLSPTEPQDRNRARLSPSFPTLGRFSRTGLSVTQHEVFRQHHCRRCGHNIQGTDR